MRTPLRRIADLDRHDGRQTFAKILADGRGCEAVPRTACHEIVRASQLGPRCLVSCAEPHLHSHRPFSSKAVHGPSVTPSPSTSYSADPSLRLIRIVGQEPDAPGFARTPLADRGGPRDLGIFRR